MWGAVAIAKVGLFLAFLGIKVADCQRSPCIQDDIDMCHYETHDEMITKLNRIQNLYPSMAKVGTVGRSSHNRELAYIKISRNVNGPRGLGVPMFKYVANMHGDETVGRQMLIYLAQYLVQEYPRNPRVARLVNNTDIYLMPSMNPDGYSSSKPGCTRGGLLGNLFSGFSFLSGKSGRENANGVDLNRNFPKRFKEDLTQPLWRLMQGKEPETAAVMQWITNNPFVLSANIHGGAVVASYPYDDSKFGRDGIYSASPDDKFFRHVSKSYSFAHKDMSKGNQCGDNFPDGVTNGAHWYDVSGGMQDFNYFLSNCFEITLELSCCKHPPASTLAEEWLKNKDAMLTYMEAIHSGVKGLVVSATDGKPLQNAIIEVNGIEKKILTTDRGEYWRLLAPGTYQIRAHASGFTSSDYTSVTIGSHNQVLTSGTPVFKFSLTPLSD